MKKASKIFNSARKYLVPAVLGAPSCDVLLVGCGAARTRSTTTRAVSAAGAAGEGAVEVLRSHTDSASLAKGRNSDESNEEEDKGHFDLDLCVFYTVNDRSWDHLIAATPVQRGPR